MGSARQLILWHDHTGELPRITFAYDVRLHGITCTASLEVYVLLERLADAFMLLVNVEDAFTDSPALLGVGETVLVDNFVMMIRDGVLWQCELGDDSWTFVKNVARNAKLIAAPNRGPWEDLPEHRYCLAGGHRVTMDDGQTFMYPFPVRDVGLLAEGPVALAGGTLFFKNKAVCNGLSDAQTSYVRGENVYVTKGPDVFILRQDAISHHRKPRIRLGL